MTQQMKPETRRPKPERNAKAETRIGHSPAAYDRASLAADSDFGFRPSFGLRISDFGLRPKDARRAFTLIELLIVIAIIAILAGLVIPISGAVNRNKMRAKARVELEQVATAIELYKAKLGHYPPDNHPNLGPVNTHTNQLYFELMGTTFSNGVYVTLDGSAHVMAASLPSAFGPGGVGGFVNCTQGSAGDEGRVATSFLPGLKPSQVADVSTNASVVNLLPNVVKVLVSSIPAPANTIWFPGNPSGQNPICYNSSFPTNNPNSYDLWVDVVISGKTNRISNWSREPITVGVPY